MFKKLAELWDKWSTTGIKWPYLFDPTTEQPSITLGMLYIASLLMFSSLIALHFNSDLLTANLTAVMVWVLSYVMYRLRKIDKASFNLKDGSISLEDAPDENNKQDDKSESV